MLTTGFQSPSPQGGRKEPPLDVGWKHLCVVGSQLLHFLVVGVSLSFFASLSYFSSE
jgi:hypothetical protein